MRYFIIHIDLGTGIPMGSSSYSTLELALHYYKIAVQSNFKNTSYILCDETQYDKLRFPDG